jgi:hypothetical protein
VGYEKTSLGTTPILPQIKIRKDIPDFEIYREVNPDITKQFFEICLPIE